MDESDVAHDPQEDDPVLGPIIRAADAQAEREAERWVARGEPGFCHAVWAAKKSLLRERHGIDWRSPAEMNPDSLFD